MEIEDRIRDWYREKVIRAAESATVRELKIMLAFLDGIRSRDREQDGE